MEGNIQAIWLYKKMPTIRVSATPDFISTFLLQSVPSLSNSGMLPPVLSSSESLLSSSTSTSPSTLGSPFSNSGESWSQPRQIQAPQDKMQKLEAKLKWMEEIIGDSGFDMIGEFLQILFYNPICISGKQYFTLPGLFHMDSIPFSGWIPYGMSSWNHNSTLVSYHFQGGFHMEWVHGIIIFVVSNSKDKFKTYL